MIYKMMRKILAYGLLALLIVGCEESYPALYMEKKASDPYVPVQNGENGRVPIILTMADPEYEILTRGMGAFEDYDDSPEEAERWLNADFRVFSYLTGNLISARDPKATINYEARPNGADSLYCMLFNQRIRLQDKDGKIKFYDKDEEQQELLEVTKYYNMQRQDWKYNFFTFYADDACDPDAPNAYTAKKDQVSIGVRLDGSQDVMHAVAYHTEEQLEEAIEDLDDVESKPLHEYKNELVYSTMAAHRGIQPIFNANHLLTRIDFYIRGAENPSAVGVRPDGYRQIVVRKVSVVGVPFNGTLTVAKDSWKDAETYKNEIASGQVLTFDGQTQDYVVKMKQKPVTDEYPWLVDDPLYQERPYEEGDAQYHITSTSIDTLGAPILLPPSSGFKVKLEVDFVNTKADDSRLDDKIRSMEDHVYNIVYEDGFKAGHAYKVIISVYGIQQVGGELHLNAWIGKDAQYDGSSDDHIIHVGGDDDDEFQIGD